MVGMRPPLAGTTITVGGGHSPVEALSLGVAIVMLALYGLGSRFGMPRAARTARSPTRCPARDAPHWTLGQSIAILAFSTIGVVWLSESLVQVAEAVIASLGISEFFLGIILVPLIGNVAEHLVAVQMALKNKMDLSTEIAISSSLQIALFVAPAAGLHQPADGTSAAADLQPLRAAGAAGGRRDHGRWYPATANRPGSRARACWRSISSSAWLSSCCHEQS